MNREVTVALSWMTSKVKTFDDLTKIELLVPGTGAGADSEIIPLAINSLAGTKFKIIYGYPSGPEMSLAMERGELDAFAADELVLMWIGGHLVLASPVDHDHARSAQAFVLRGTSDWLTLDGGADAGGDAVRGPSLVVHAVRDARRAAAGIDRWLRDQAV